MGQGVVQPGEQTAESDDSLIVRGYLHGSANQAVLRMLAEIGDKKADPQEQSAVEGLAAYLLDAQVEAPSRH